MLENPYRDRLIAAIAQVTEDADMQGILLRAISGSQMVALAGATSGSRARLSGSPAARPFGGRLEPTRGRCTSTVGAWATSPDARAWTSGSCGGS